MYGNMWVNFETANPVELSTTNEKIKAIQNIVI